MPPKIPFKGINKLIMVDIIHNDELWINSFLPKGGFYTTVIPYEQKNKNYSIDASTIL